MKIGIIVQDLFGQGVEYATAAVTRGLIANGHSVDLIVSKCHKDRMKNGAVKPFAVPTETNWIHLPSRKARHNVLAIRHYLKTSDADAVLSTSGPYHLALRLARIGLRNIPLVVEMNHGNFGLVNDLPVAKPKLFSKYYLKLRWLHGGFDRVMFVSKTSQLTFLKFCPFYARENTFVVYNPVIDEEFERKILLPPQHPWLVNKTCPVFISAGSCDSAKDQMTMLRAILRLKGKVSAKFIHFGVGKLKATYEEFVRENHLEDMISIAGYTNQLPAEMKHADGFILTSKAESFGIVLVEALACGLSVISTAAPYGPREILDNGRYGDLVPVGDDEALALAIAKVAEGERRKVPDGAWDKYTVSEIADRYVRGIRGCE